MHSRLYRIIKFILLVTAVCGTLCAANTSCYADDYYFIEHWITGTVETTWLPSGEPNGREVRLSPYGDHSKYYSDIVGVTGRSGVSRTYMIDAKMIPGYTWEVGASLEVYLPISADAFFAGPVAFNSTGAGVDTAPILNMEHLSNPPVVTVEYPNGGEMFAGGASIEVTWTALDDITPSSSLEIKIYYTSSDAWSLIVTTNESASGAGVYEWVLPIGWSSTEVRISIEAKDEQGNVGADVSDTVFIVDSDIPLVHIITPEAGMIVTTESVQVIGWTASDATTGLTSTVMLYLSIDNGDTWLPISAEAESTGIYSNWIPTDPTTEAKLLVFVSDLVGNFNFEISPTFEIVLPPDYEAPTVEVLYPNGGEIFEGGHTIEVMWQAGDDRTANDQLNIKVYYTSSEVWNLLTATPTHEDISGVGTFEWYLPLSWSSAEVRVSVEAMDLSGNSSTDASNNVFAIDNDYPTITVISPETRVSIEVMVPHAIKWIATDETTSVSTVTAIYRSVDGGVSWVLITAEIANTGEYIWTPMQITTEARILVQVRDTVGHSSVMAMSGTFEIMSPPNFTPPLVQVIYPNGGEIFKGGTTIEVTWISTDDVIPCNQLTFNVYYTSGEAWKLLTLTPTHEDASGIGTFEWTLPLGWSSNEVRVSVEAHDLSGNVSSDASNNVFIIDNDYPVITVITPEAGSKVTAESSQIIGWTVADPTTSVATITAIYLSTDEGSTWNTLTTEVDNYFSRYSWTFTVLTTEAMISVEARDIVGHNSFGLSGMFEIVRPPNYVPPIVRVIYPNGGEMFKGGTTVEVTWTATDDVTLSKDISIKLSYASSDAWSLLTTTNETSSGIGTYEWTLPSTWSSAEVRVSVEAIDLSGNIGSDESDNVFAIDNDIPVVSVLSPEAGNIITAETAYTITWEASDPTTSIESISIFFSPNGGTSWQTVITNETNDGVYNWMVPAYVTNEAVISVEAIDMVGHAGYGVSALFEISSGEVSRPTSLEIERVYGADTDVKIMWSGDMPVDIYTLTPAAGLYFDYNGSWVKEISVSGTTEWVDPNAHLYDQRYYRVATKDTIKYAIDINGSYEAVGKFNVPVSESDPTKFFISNPLKAKTDSIADVFQGEAQEGEFVVYVDSNGYPLQAAQFFADVWWDLNTGDTSNMQIMGGKGYGYQSVSSRNIVLVGKVGSEDNVSTIEGGALAYYIGSAFPREYTLPESGLNVSSKGYDSQSAGIMSYVDINGIPTESWMHVEDNAWYDLFTGDVSTQKMKPGKGYVFSEPIQPSIIWVQIK